MLTDQKVASLNPTRALCIVWISSGPYEAEMISDVSWRQQNNGWRVLMLNMKALCVKSPTFIFLFFVGIAFLWWTFVLLGLQKSNRQGNFRPRILVQTLSEILVLHILFNYTTRQSSLKHKNLSTQNILFSILSLILSIATCVHLHKTIISRLISS